MLPQLTCRLSLADGKVTWEGGSMREHLAVQAHLGAPVVGDPSAVSRWLAQCAVNVETWHSRFSFSISGPAEMAPCANAKISGRIWGLPVSGSLKSAKTRLAPCPELALELRSRLQALQALPGLAASVQ